MKLPTKKPCDFPKYQAAFERVQDVRQQLEEQQQRVNELNSLTADSLDHEQRSARHVAAEAIAAGDDYDSATATVDSVTQEMQAVYVRRDTLTAALGIAERKLAMALSEVSGEYFSEIRADYLEILRSMAAGIKQLRSACLAERRFRESINDAGFGMFGAGVQAMGFLTVGGDDTNPDTFTQWLAEAKLHFGIS